MIGLIVFFGVLAAVAMVGIKGGEYIASRLGSVESIGKRVSVVRMTSVLAPVVAFLTFSVMTHIVAPAPAEFTTTTAAWETQDAGFFGSLGNAILVRVPGATVEKGLLYNTATLRGETWVSVPGSTQWVNGGLGYVVLAYAVSLVIVGGFTAAFGVVLAHGKTWMNTAKVAYNGAASAVAAAKPAAPETAPAPAPEPVAPAATAAA